jgi:hypothetical protein
MLCSFSKLFMFSVSGFASLILFIRSCYLPYNILFHFRNVQDQMAPPGAMLRSSPQWHRSNGSARASRLCRGTGCPGISGEGQDGQSAVLTPELDSKFHERNKHQGRVTYINGFFAVWFSMVFHGFPPCAMFQALHRSPALICLNHDVKVSSIDSCRAQELLGVKVHHLMTRPQDATMLLEHHRHSESIVFETSMELSNMNYEFLNGRCLVLSGQPLT